MATHLKLLLQQRHLQSHNAFTREYDRLAKAIDPVLVGSGPSRATLHRWMTGTVKSAPYPDHCQILEAMFPGWTAARLLAPCEDDQLAVGPDVQRLMSAIRQGLDAPDAAAWPARSASAARPTQERMPPSLSQRIGGDDDNPAPELGRRLLNLQRRLGLDDDELHELAALAGQVVELGLDVTITIEASGDAVVLYEHHVLNLCSTPLQRLGRELWFEHTSVDKLRLAPVHCEGRQLMLQRLHNTPQLAKFACQFSPTVEPGAAVRFGYSCLGGLFLEDFYWRQAIVRPTRHTTITIRQRSGTLVRCSAIEEHPDGSETVATDQVLWDHDGPDITMSLARDHLAPGQALTLRWEIERDPVPTR